jgi:hypothetical protein
LTRNTKRRFNKKSNDAILALLTVLEKSNVPFQRKIEEEKTCLDFIQRAAQPRASMLRVLG